MAMQDFSPDYVDWMDMLALLADTLPWQPGYADYAGFVPRLAVSICWLRCLWISRLFGLVGYVQYIV
jgi:hypothetical protein